MLSQENWLRRPSLEDWREELPMDDWRKRLHLDDLRKRLDDLAQRFSRKKGFVKMPVLTPKAKVYLLICYWSFILAQVLVFVIRLVF